MFKSKASVIIKNAIVVPSEANAKISIQLGPYLISVSKIDAPPASICTGGNCFCEGANSNLIAGF